MVFTIPFKKKFKNSMHKKAVSTTLRFLYLEMNRNVYQQKYVRYTLRKKKQQ